MCSYCIYYCSLLSSSVSPSSLLKVPFTNEDRSKDDGSCEKYYFSFSFSVLDHQWIFPFDFARDTRTEKVKRFNLEDKQGLSNFVDVYDVHRTPKVSFPRRIKEDDGEEAVSTLHSNVQLLFSLIKTIVLCRSRPRILKSLLMLSSYVVTLKKNALFLQKPEISAGSNKPVWSQRI